MAGPNFFWDSCVFNAFLYDERNAYDVDSIVRYLADAKDQKCRIYTSEIFLAEVRNSKIKNPKYGSTMEFINDYAGATVPIAASIPIMELTGRLKDIPYRKEQSDKRQLSTGDGIMLATCLLMPEMFGVAIDIFHTFDDGRKKKQIPLLSYEKWCEGLTGEHKELANRVCKIVRKIPVHPQPELIRR